MIKKIIPLPKTENTFRNVPQDKEREIDFTDLSDPRAWTETFKNIGTGVYDGLKTVYKIFSPLSWLP